MATIKYKDTGGVWQTAGTPTSLYTYSYDGTNKIHILTGSGTFGQVEFLTQYVSGTDTITVNGTTVIGIYLGGLIAQTLRPSFYSFVYNGSDLYFQTSAIYNSLDQTSSGFALDARQGKTLNDAITTRGIPSGGTTGQALLKSSATDYATGWSAVGRTNPNILHNSDWLTPVNQRAHTGAITNAYCIDRWIGNGTVTPVAGSYVTLANTTTMIQRMEILPAKLAEKQITASVEIGGSIQFATLTFPAAGAAPASSALAGVTVKVGHVNLGTGNTALLDGMASQYIPYVSITATAAINIARVKLEMGEVSTLAMDAPMDYGRELARCQRYLSFIPAYNRIRVSVIQQGYMDFVVPLPVQLRSKPTILGAITVNTLNNTVQTGFAFGIEDGAGIGGSIMIRASKASHGMNDANLSTTTNCLLSAEL